jgi:hypothetical protein
MIVRRHPVLGIFGGALVGIGVALLLIMFSVAPVADLTVVVVVVFFAILGLLYALLIPPRARVP